MGKVDDAVLAERFNMTHEHRQPGCSGRCQSHMLRSETQRYGFTDFQFIRRHCDAQASCPSEAMEEVRSDRSDLIRTASMLD